MAHHRLNNLTILVDHNGLQGFGNTGEIASMMPLQDKLRGFDVDILIVPGHNLEEIRDALKVKSSRPKIIILQTVKGNGVSFMMNKMEWHYLPLDDALYQKALNELENS